ncbi:hypothetical protein [Microbacterium sp. CGR2]|uniref:hypothetical protein n=1 Tax=Microbacterium sp. CGR2 TaxID=1805820 RepID=UPI000EAA114B|nr:hypothetical protein [Microbacterium sp. CGR2]RKN68762.1 hypothetical protein D7252_15025 [Microbacterium sp. CGR2]
MSSETFSDAQLVQACIDVTTGAFGATVDFDVDGARIEQRTADPDWLVLVPAAAEGFDGEAQCTIGGSPSAPVIGLSSASIEPLPEEQIQNLIAGKNEGGTQ